MGEILIHRVQKYKEEQRIRGRKKFGYWALTKHKEEKESSSEVYVFSERFLWDFAYLIDLHMNL